MTAKLKLQYDKNRYPVIETERLVLRAFSLRDAPNVQKLAGDKDIALTTLLIPHPYEDGVAEEWIGKHQEEFKKEKSVIFAIVDHKQDFLIGSIGLTIDKESEKAELGYWIGKPYWNNGYCSEAAKAVLEYGFGILGLNRIYAHYLNRNPASGRVLQKIGLSYEGCLRQHIKKWDVFEDMIIYGILKTDLHSKRLKGDKKWL
ncbi:MAG: GNAT family N-acetyltransferase [Planctomycetes bacterium]|nr:GNAT family N-acetyltransferase [Planctomycetota bacterium]